VVENAGAPNDVVEKKVLSGCERGFTVTCLKTILLKYKELVDSGLGWGRLKKRMVK
jgi:hypothetical protein